LTAHLISLTCWRGMQVDNSGSIAPILAHINAQHGAYLKKELAIVRPPVIVDTRIHACLYFIAPTGHGLKPLDVAFMRELHHSVNLIPVIAKSDAFTIAERNAFKLRIREDLFRHQIRVFPWPLSEDDAEDEAAKTDVQERLPFAVVGATDELMENGKYMRGRQTAWGFVDVDNPEHCELPLLRDALIRVYLADLKQTTAQVHYELYREQHLTGPDDPV
jgi:septin 3/9/12